MTVYEVSCSPFTSPSCLLLSRSLSLLGGNVVHCHRSLVVIMLYPLSQTPVANPNPFSVQSSSAWGPAECQEIRRMPMASNASVIQSALPKIPASVKLATPTNQSPEVFRPSRSDQANGSSRERGEQRPCQSGPVYGKERDGESRHSRQDSLHNMPSDPEKANGEQSPRESARPSPSRRPHTTIHYEPDDMEDEGTAEAHSVWILVSRYLLVHLMIQTDKTWRTIPRS